MKMRAPTHLKDLQRYFRYSCEQIGIEHIPLLASPPRSASAAARSLKGVAERVTKYREASADREAGVVFRSKTKRKTTPAAAASVASQYLIDDAATPCGDARRGMALDCNSFTAVFYERRQCSSLDIAGGHRSCE